MTEQGSVVKETLIIHEWTLNFIDLFYLLAFIEGVQKDSAERQEWFKTYNSSLSRASKGRKKEIILAISLKWTQLTNSLA